MDRPIRRFQFLALFILVSISVVGQPSRIFREPACATLAPASAGGPLPRSPSLMVIRYLGTSNYEVAYRGKVLLLDTFYDGQRGPEARKIGIKGNDVKRADSILIGHPHIDHIADAPAIAKRLGSLIFVSPAGRPVLDREQVPAKSIRYVRGGEEIKLSGYTVMTALARHSALDPQIASRYMQAAAATEPPGAELLNYLKSIAAYNPQAGNDPELDIPTRGTIAYVIVFDSGFKIAFRDSPGAVTDGERELMKKVGGRVDVGIIAHQGFGERPVLDVTLPLAKLYSPKLFLPAHQDKLFGGITDYSVTPLLMKFRDELPMTKGLDPMYRSPVCIDTRSGEFYYGHDVK